MQAPKTDAGVYQNAKYSTYLGSDVGIRNAFALLHELEWGRICPTRYTVATRSNQYWIAVTFYLLRKWKALKSSGVAAGTVHFASGLVGKRAIMGAP